jgi:hypothetical protein
MAAAILFILGVGISQANPISEEQANSFNKRRHIHIGGFSAACFNSRSGIKEVNNSKNA